MDGEILIVEDDSYLSNFIYNRLTKEGYSCTIAINGSQCLKILKNRYFDLIIMDLDLGDMDGKDILKLLRNQSNPIPVIIVSTFDNIDRKVNLFDIGCDDYVTKPFYIEELLARIKRQLKRSKAIYSSESFNKTPFREEISFNGIRLNYQSSSLYKNGQKIELTKKLFDLFSFFITNSNQVITKEQLISRFWNDSDIFPENTLTVHIHKLRSIIEDNPSSPIFLKTKRGLGYIFIR